MKKLIFVITLLLCSCGTGNTIDEYTYIYKAELSNNTDELCQRALDQRLQDYFGLRFNYILINSDFWHDEINKYFASGKNWDIIGGGNVSMYRNMDHDGLLFHFDINDLYNYRSLPEDFEWNGITNNDGQVFYIPYFNNSTNGWFYERAVFDRLKIRPPRNTNEMYSVLKRLRAQYPSSVLMSAEGGLRSYSFAGLFQAFMMPTDSLDLHSYVNPESGEFIPFAFASDNARDFFIFINTLYEENLIDREMLVISDRQYKGKLSDGQIFYGYGNTSNLNESVFAIAPNVNAYNESYTYLQSRLSESGIAVSHHAKNPDKLASYIDWCASNDAEQFTIALEMQDGINVSGIPNLRNIPLLSPVQSGDYVSKPLYLKYPDNAIEKRVHELEAALINIREQYFYRFFIGELNPSSDDDWNLYIHDLRAVGLDEYEQIQTEAYNEIILLGLY